MDHNGHLEQLRSIFSQMAWLPLIEMVIKTTWRGRSNSISLSSAPGCFCPHARDEGSLELPSSIMCPGSDRYSQDGMLYGGCPFKEILTASISAHWYAVSAQAGIALFKSFRTQG
jgi:hypothetical protein